MSFQKRTKVVLIIVLRNNSCLQKSFVHFCFKNKKVSLLQPTYDYFNDARLAKDKIVFQQQRKCFTFQRVLQWTSPYKNILNSYTFHFIQSVHTTNDRDVVKLMHAPNTLTTTGYTNPI